MDNISRIPKPDEVLEYKQGVDDDDPRFQAALGIFNCRVASRSWSKDVNIEAFAVEEIPSVFREKIVKCYRAAGWDAFLDIARELIPPRPFIYLKKKGDNDL